MVQKCWLFGNSTDPERPAPAERVWKVRIARLSQKAMIQNIPIDCLTTSGVLPTIEPGLKNTFRVFHRGLDVHSSPGGRRFFPQISADLRREAAGTRVVFAPGGAVHLSGLRAHLVNSPDRGGRSWIENSASGGLAR